MKLVTHATEQFVDDLPFDIVERKGKGHPDTLADGLAEELSREYSLRCLSRYGVILHHNTDKTALLGGSAHVAFGEGYLTSPIEVLVNGRFSSGVGGDLLGVEGMVDEVSRCYLGGMLPLLDRQRDLRIRPRISAASSPGHVHAGRNGHSGSRAYWFNPRSVDDLAELRRMFSNDTSCGVGYAPASQAELVARSLEERVTDPVFQLTHPEYGTDVKVMACRAGSEMNVTICVPQIARYTPDLNTYVQRKQELLAHLRAWTEELCPTLRPRVSLNTRDDHERRELYLTATGSSIESGDEGVVGRGNRGSGVIATTRPMSMEGAAGKNPVYHVGKVYNLAATEAARRLYEETGLPTTVWLVSQSGRDLEDPWFAAVQQSRTGAVCASTANRVVEEVVSSLHDLRDKVLGGRVAVF